MTGGTQLQSLDMSHCYNITDAGIRALATGCTQLHTLDISWCHNITDEGWEIAQRICKTNYLNNSNEV